MSAPQSEIDKARALLESSGFVVKETVDSDWHVFGAVVTCNMIAPGLTEKKFIQMVERYLTGAFATKHTMKNALGNDVISMGPLHVKSYKRVRSALLRKAGETAPQEPGDE